MCFFSVYLRGWLISLENGIANSMKSNAFTSQDPIYVLLLQSYYLNEKPKTLVLLSPACGLYQNRRRLPAFRSQNVLFLQILSISGFNVKYLASPHKRSSYEMLHYFVGFFLSLRQGHFKYFHRIYYFQGFHRDPGISLKSQSTEDII